VPIYETGVNVPWITCPNASFDTTWNVLVPLASGTVMLYVPVDVAVVVVGGTRLLTSVKVIVDPGVAVPVK
jgi:hypothetical protein